jgi:hypothetical protein
MRLRWKCLAALTCSLNSMANTNLGKSVSNLQGEWACLQESIVSESIIGTNTYNINLPLKEGVSKQKGTVVIQNLSSFKNSKVEYFIELKTTFEEELVVHTILDISEKIINDDLQAFGDDESGLFPKVGTLVQAKYDVISSMQVRATYSDGNVVNCSLKK